MRISLRTIGHGYGRRADRETVDGRFSVTWQTMQGSQDHWLVMDRLELARPCRCPNLEDVTSYLREVREDESLGET